VRSGTPTPVHAALQLALGFPLARLRPSRPLPAPAWTANAPTVTIAFANLLFSNPRLDAAVHQIVDVDADVAVLVEVTEAAATIVKRAGALDRYPAHVVNAQRGGYGSALLSRIHTDAVELDVHAGMTVPRATVRVGTTALDVFGVHTQAPVVGWKTRRWNTELAALAALQTDRPTIAPGDYNAVRWHPPFKRLLHSGWTDAHEALGLGRSLSWWQMPFPPFALARLDHSLHQGDVWPVAMRELDRCGSDHQPFVVTYAVRQD
jgi:endonuclease/exonuclease/phosphatase (EEP) superfamily protein YafD